MSSTIAAYVSALSGLTVTGVTRKYTEPPTQVNTADLPCMYPRIPELSDAPITACGQGGWPTHTAELVILVEPIAQNRQNVNFALVLSLIDALQAALQAAKPTTGKRTWQIRQEIVEHRPDTLHWAIIATVTGVA